MQGAHPSSASRSVLVVDDNRDLAENLGEVLELAGAEVVVVYDAKAAIQRLASGRFHLVVTDMRMPGMGGLALLKYIRARMPRIPVVIVSAYSRDALLEEAKTAGALDVLSKPIDLARLCELLDDSLRGPSHAC